MGMNTASKDLEDARKELEFAAQRYAMMHQRAHMEPIEDPNGDAKGDDPHGLVAEFTAILGERVDKVAVSGYTLRYAVEFDAEQMFMYREACIKIRIEVESEYGPGLWIQEPVLLSCDTLRHFQEDARAWIAAGVQVAINRLVRWRDRK